MLFQTDSQGRLPQNGNRRIVRGPDRRVTKDRRSAFQTACEDFIAALPAEHQLQIHAIAEAEGIPDYSVLPMALDKLILSRSE
jgi:hypothetical protein